ncbi:MAG: hypothetical protein P1U86_09020 [Verrucomicrobiales bacterium]|nr:hypothetical protein [Verrucomicrobiales bacterium]
MDQYERRIEFLPAQFPRVSLKLIVNFLAVLLGSNLLVGCDSDKAGASPEGSKAVSTEGAQRVIEELEAFLNTEERETITMTKEDAERVLSILRPSDGDVVKPAAEPEPLPEKVAAKESAQEMEKPEAKPVSVNREMKAQPLAKKPAEVPGDKDGEVSEKDELKKSADSEGGVAGIPDSDTKRPEGYEDKLVDPTTGFEFEWSPKKGVWVSTEFADYLKGSSKQNESFSWLLTQNSSGADKGAVPEGWVYLPLADRKSIAIAEKSRTGEIQAAVGRVDALPVKPNGRKADALKVKASETVPPAESEEDKSREMEKVDTAKPVAVVTQPTGLSGENSAQESAKIETTPADSKSDPAPEMKGESDVPPVKPVEPPAKKVAANPAPAPAEPVDEPARFRPVSEILPVGAMLPDGRRLVAPPQYETRQYVSPGQTQARPVLRAVPARKVDVQAPAKANENTDASESTGGDGVPTANSKPVVRPTLTIKSRRVGKLWKNTQEDQPVQPTQ